MSRVLDISELVPSFPGFRVAAVLADGLTIPPQRPLELDALIAEREEACRARLAGMELSAIPGIAAWRQAYRAFGIKRTSYRPSVERLVKNVLADRPLPRINSFVDGYNAVSLTHVVPLGADDLDKVEGDLAFRYARDGDSFVDMGAEEGEDPNDPPKPGEVVYADGVKVLCRRWNWRQDARSVITPETRSAVITVQWNGIGDLEAAVADLKDILRRFCGARVACAVADADRPTVPLPDPAAP